MVGGGRFCPPLDEIGLNQPWDLSLDTEFIVDIGNVYLFIYRQVVVGDVRCQDRQPDM